MDIKLNLISPERKKEIKKRFHLETIIKTEIVLTLILLFFFTALLSFGYILNLYDNAFQSSQEKNGKIYYHEKIKDYDEKFTQINSQISEISNLEKEQLYWSNLFSKLNTLIFPEIEIVSLDTEEYYITLNGIANNRDNLILFKEKLEKEECFSNINLPLSNLVNKNNIEFEINFTLNKNCLKKQQ